jgi:hypothetical protein
MKQMHAYVVKPSTEYQTAISPRHIKPNVGGFMGIQRWMKGS